MTIAEYNNLSPEDKIKLRAELKNVPHLRGYIELALYTGLKPSTLRKMVHLGDFPSHNGLTMWHRLDVDRVLRDWKYKCNEAAH